MNTRKRSRAIQPIDILLTDITKESTCNSFPLPLHWTSELCISQRDVTLEQRESVTKKQRQKTVRRRCLQIWDSSWKHKRNVSTNKLLLHNLVRGFLKIDDKVNIDYSSAY